MDELDLLHQIYGEIITTSEIEKEYGEPLPNWIKIVNAKDRFRQQLLELQIDKGESSAIALATEVPDSTLILDDFKARKIATKLNLKFTGTIGVIIKAKQNGIISSIKPILSKLKQTNFRISPNLSYKY